MPSRTTRSMAQESGESGKSGESSADASLFDAATPKAGDGDTTTTTTGDATPKAAAEEEEAGDATPTAARSMDASEAGDGGEGDLEERKRRAVEWALGGPGWAEKLLGDEWYTPMCLASVRLKTFPGRWCHGAKAKCCPAALAEAGWVYIGSKDSPDAVKAWCCGKELEGFEPDDDAWEEHRSHSKACRWAELAGPEERMSVRALLEGFRARALYNLRTKYASAVVQPYQDKVNTVRALLEAKHKDKAQ